jgi:HAD superfamily hydrolase (TIGR01544 family)
MARAEHLKNMPTNVIISNPEKLKNLIRKFKEQGPDKIHVLADFDRTFTYAFVNGEKIPSVISILRKENILDEAYTKRTEELFAVYHAYEIDLAMPLADKKGKMAEWWDLHNQELLKHGLKQKHLDIVAQSPKMKLRQGLAEFLTILNTNQIPVVIMSASGLGDYVIAKILEREKINFPNINIISNSPEFDQKGNLIGFKKPFIHVLSKTETMLKDFPAYKKVKDRKNVILLGDNIEDIGMVEGFDSDNLIKIGFLNENVKENSDEYIKLFDVVLLNDADFTYPNQLINQII